MKYRNKLQIARKKYLEGSPLSDQEQVLIEKDFFGSDFSFFISEDKPFVLPDKYNAETTFMLIDERIKQNTSIKRKPFIKYISYVAAILVLATLSTIGYNLATRPVILYASTTYGEKKEVKLPDGSVVVLNSMSSISYPQEMKEKTREVTLQGEAYFDVVKNSGKTFIVKADNIEVKVLGTKFNVKAYEKEDYITTTLYEGAVSVGMHSGHTNKLKPGEQAIFEKKAEKIETRQFRNSGIGPVWRKNLLIFDNEKLSDILGIISREHNVIFEIEDETLKQLRITARFGADESVEKALTILGKSAEFTFIKQNNKYKIISRK
jgi:transmembrane sensor